MLSEFEMKTLDLGAGLHGSTFGRDLRRFNSQVDRPSDSSQSLASLSLNNGPPIHRTEWALEFARATGQELNLEDEAELLEWWLDASGLLLEMASLCWEPVPTGLRASVYDEDDLGPLFSYYIPHTREGPRPSDARLADLRSKEFWPEFESFVEAAQSTSAYAAVVDAAGSLTKKDRRRLQRLAREIGSRLDEEMADIGYDEVRSRAPALVANAYDSAPRSLREFAQAARAYNELLNHAFWAALAITESDDGIVVIDSVPVAMRLTQNGRYEDLTLALERVGGLFFLSPPAPFLVEAAGPIDGVYLTRRQMVQWRGETIADVSGRRLAALEQGLDLRSGFKRGQAHA